MSNTFLYIAWGVMYAACAGLGFVAAPTGAAYGLMIFFSLVFFLPPAVLLHRAIRCKNEKMLRLIRNLSLIWLCLAMVMLVVNIASVALSETAGLVLYCLLVVTTAPMICGQIWLISLFLWACLLVVSWKHIPKEK